MRVLVWLIRAFLFFTLFAFALNNQQPVTVHWFFGAEWQAPMVIVMLVVFAAGAALGIVAMLPGAWRRWRHRAAPSALVEEPSAAPEAAPSAFGPEPPRVGL
jgi:uncharacterized integral membrane protein